MSATQLADSAAKIRRQAALTGDMTRAWNASSAAAGALMLSDRALTEMNAALQTSSTTSVITPRRTRLVRVPDLRAFRRVIVRWSEEAVSDGPDRSAIVVPTRGAATELGRALRVPAARAASSNPRSALRRAALAARVLPRAADRVRARRDRAGGSRRGRARRRRAAVSDPSGAGGEMLRFYDHLRRQSQHVERFEALITDALGGDAEDGSRHRASAGADAIPGWQRFADTNGAWSRVEPATSTCCAND